MAKRANAKKNRVRAGLLTKVILMLLLVATGWQLYRLQERVADAQTEKERYAAAVAEMQRENDALQADLDEGPTPEKIEEIAREELGLVNRNEYVIVDSSD